MMIWGGIVLVVAGCALPPEGKGELSRDPTFVLNRTWRWESTVTPVERIAVADPDRYTLKLTADGKAQIQFDCNRGGGEFKIAEGTLSFGPLLSTRMACPPDSQDSLFMRDLERVVSFFVENDTLFLEMPYDSGTMRFSPTR